MIFTIVLLAILILFYACLAHNLFYENDPMRFGTFGISIITFFQLATFEGWTEVYRSNYFGCDAYPGLYDEIEEEKIVETFFGSFNFKPCDNPSAHPAASTMIFISFEILAPYVIVSMCLSAVVIGIRERLTSFRSEIKMKDTTSKVEEAAIKSQRFATTEAKKELLSMVHRIWEGREGVIAHAQAEIERASHGDFSDFSRKSLALDVEFLIEHRSYEVLVCVWIFGEAILQLFEEVNGVADATHAIHWVFQVGFLVDLLLRILSHIDKELQFFENGWNTFHLFVTVSLLFPLIQPTEDAYQFLVALRLLRVSWILKFFMFNGDLKVVMDAISSSFRGLVYVGLFIITFFLYSSLAAMLLFKHSDPYHFSTIASTLQSLFQVMTLDLWSEVMRAAMYGCHNINFHTGLEKFDRECTGEGLGAGWLAPIFFIPFVILSAHVCASIFVGVIIASLELLKEGAGEEADIWEKVERVKENRRVDHATIDILLKLFEHLDDEGDATLCFEEIKPVFMLLNMPENEQFEAFLTVDEDSSGKVDFSEFCELLLSVGDILSPPKQVTRRHATSFGVLSSRLAFSAERLDVKAFTEKALIDLLLKNKRKQNFGGRRADEEPKSEAVNKAVHKFKDLLSKKKEPGDIESSTVTSAGADRVGNIPKLSPSHPETQSGGAGECDTVADFSNTSSVPTPGKVSPREEFSRYKPTTAGNVLVSSSSLPSTFSSAQVSQKSSTRYSRGQRIFVAESAEDHAEDCDDNVGIFHSTKHPAETGSYDQEEDLQKMGIRKRSPAPRARINTDDWTDESRNFDFRPPQCSSPKVGCLTGTSIERFPSTD